MQFTRRKKTDGLELSNIHGKGYFLCSDHFEDDQYNCLWEKKRLVWNAVPALFSIPNPLRGGGVEGWVEGVGGGVKGGERERERERCLYILIYFWLCLCVYASQVSETTMYE